MADEPIKTGAAGLSALVDEVGSEISTDDYGIDVGTVTFFCPSQSQLMSIRPARGSVYAGSLPQFSGFICDSSSPVGREGDTGAVRSVYMKINSTISTANESLAILSADVDSRSIALTDEITADQVPVPNPVMTFRYASSNPLDGAAVGTFSFPGGSSPGGSFAVTMPASDGVSYILNFTPNVNGYMFTNFDAEPLCGGAIYRIRKTHKLQFNYASYAPA